MKFRKLKKLNKNLETKKSSFAFASYAYRVKAFIVDLFMIYAPILYVITYAVMNGKGDFQSSQLAPFVGVAVYGFIYAYMLSKSGQTPGKKAYDLRVVDDKDGKNITFVRALLRFVMFLLSATILVGLLTPFYRKDKKGLHDLICKTVVVAEDATPSK